MENITHDDAHEHDDGARDQLQSYFSLVSHQRMAARMKAIRVAAERTFLFMMIPI